MRQADSKMMVTHLVHTWDVGAAAGLEEPDPILMGRGSFNGWFTASDSELFRNLRFRMLREDAYVISAGHFGERKQNRRGGISWRLTLSPVSPHSSQSKSHSTSVLGMFI